MTDKLLKHRKLFTVIFIVVGVIMTIALFVLSLFFNDGDIISWIEKLYYCVQIVAGFYVVAGAVIAVCEYYISTESELHKKQSEKIIKAVELAGYYKDNVIIPFTYVRYIYERIEAIDIIKKIEPENMNNFDLKELENNLDAEDINNLKKSITKKLFIEAVKEANLIYNVNSIETSYLDKCLAEYNAKEDQIDPLAFKIAQSYMNGQQRDMLNSLEYFAMFFTHNVADETVVFQSLHQTYFEIIETMYYYISSQNTSDQHKFYVNAIKLYDLWKKEDENNSRKGQEADEKCRELKQPSIGTVLKN
mgnify:CR=1 FL=1